MISSCDLRLSTSSGYCAEAGYSTPSLVGDRLNVTDVSGDSVTRGHPLCGSGNVFCVFKSDGWYSLLISSLAVSRSPRGAG